MEAATFRKCIIGLIAVGLCCAFPPLLGLVLVVGLLWLVWHAIGVLFAIFIWFPAMLIKGYHENKAAEAASVKPLEFEGKTVEMNIRPLGEFAPTREPTFEEIATIRRMVRS